MGIGDLKSMELPTRANLGVAVADVIRTAILNGTLKPGDTLQENTLAQELSVSRSPIREALLQLERERLVEGRVNKPSVVRRPSASEIFQIFTIRSVLEGLAARWAAELASPDIVSELTTAAKELDGITRQVPNHQPSALIGRAFDFHAAIAMASGSPDLQYVLQTLRNQIKMVMAAGIATMTESRADQIHAEHMSLIDAIATGNGDLAEELATMHVCAGRDRISLTAIEE